MPRRCRSQRAVASARPPVVSPVRSRCARRGPFAPGRRGKRSAAWRTPCSRRSHSPYRSSLRARSNGDRAPASSSDRRKCGSASDTAASAWQRASSERRAGVGNCSTHCWKLAMWTAASSSWCARTATSTVSDSPRTPSRVLPVRRQRRRRWAKTTRCTIRFRPRARLLSRAGPRRGGRAEPCQKGTVLVPTGQVADLLLDVSNPGAVDGALSIPEHTQRGMMFTCTVVDDEEPSGGVR
jgi:hypothetical protein